ncbi:6-bladed beta-propeller [Acidobacteriota bacterium]
MSTKANLCGLGNSHQRKQRLFQGHGEKRKVKFVVFLSILFIFFNASPVGGQNVKLIEKIKFSQSLPPDVRDFCLTDDELVIIPDYQASNVKIYEKNGEVLEVVNTIGRKGYGPDELSKPTACFYNKNESKFGIMDLGIRKIFLYDRIGRLDFKRVKEVSCWRGAYDIQLKGNRLLISGYKQRQDEEPYDFYYVDLTNDQTTFLLPSHYKYGLKSFREYEIEYRGKPDFPAIGIKGWFDIHNDDVYFVWEGNLKVIRLNFVSGEISLNPFGNQKTNYVKPRATKKLRESRRKIDTSIAESERAKVSYVKNIFVSSGHILVIYQGPINQGNASNFWLHFYKLNGDFVREEPIPGQPGSIMWFDKDKYLLYSLSIESNMSGGKYFILKFEISGSGGGYQ